MAPSRSLVRSGHSQRGLPALAKLAMAGQVEEEKRAMAMAMKMAEAKKAGARTGTTRQVEAVAPAGSGGSMLTIGSRTMNAERLNPEQRSAEMKRMRNQNRARKSKS